MLDIFCAGTALLQYVVDGGVNFVC